MQVLWVIFVVVLLRRTVDCSFNETEERTRARRYVKRLYFEGCYEVTDVTGLATLAADDMTNVKCIDFCNSKSHPLAATKGKSCVCFDKQPGTVLAVSSDGEKAAGPQSRCNVKCPGAMGTVCHAQTCCGGASKEYSVYGVGDMDFLKKLAENLKGRLSEIHKRTEFNIVGIVIIKLSTKMPDNKQKTCNLVGDFIEMEQFSISCTAASRTPQQQDEPEVEFQVVAAKSTNPEQSLEKKTRLRGFDLEFDNTLGKTDAKLSRKTEVKATTSQTYSTESGSESSLTVGVSASMSFEAFGAEFGAELSTQVSDSKFYQSGYQKLQEDSVTDTFQVDVTVPAGHRKIVRFYKKLTPLVLKWSSVFYAQGEFTATQMHTTKTFHLSEFLTEDERTFYGFGTITMSSQPTIVTEVETYDAKGKKVVQSDAQKPHDHIKKIS